MLIRLVKFSDASTCRQVLQILIIRTQNYLILKTGEYEKEEDGNVVKEVSLTDDDFLAD